MLKTGTITDPFTGSLTRLQEIENIIPSFSRRLLQPFAPKEIQKGSLLFIEKASPCCSVS